MTDAVDVDADAKTIESLVGRTITRALWFDQSPKQDWTGHETAWLWLDDGRVVEFGGWGHDAWGATVREIEVRDVRSCRYCRLPHPDREVCTRHLEGWPGITRVVPAGARFCWCVNGNSVAWVEGDAEASP